jgi:hypothetical protein
VIAGLLLCIALAAGGVLLGAKGLSRELELAWLALHWPQGLELDNCLAFLRQLACDQRRQLVALEIESAGGSVSYRLGVHPAGIREISRLLRSLVPGLEVVETERSPVLSNSWRIALNTRSRVLGCEAEPVARAVLAGLAGAERKERIVLQWLLGPRLRPLPVSAVTTSNGGEESLLHLLIDGRSRLEREKRAALAAKRSEHGFACVARIGVNAATPKRARKLSAGVLTGLRSAETPGVALSLKAENVQRFRAVTAPRFHWPLALNSAELAGLTGWPIGKPPLPGMPKLAARRLRADARVHSGDRVIARATAPGDERELGLPISEALQHLHVIGPTGVGKSTLLLNLIVQDIAAGRGTVVIDPKGDLVDEVLRRIPKERIGDVVVLDPADAECPVGLNPLADARRDPELVADQVLAVFHSLYEHSWGPRTQDILHASLLSLAGKEGTSLCALPVLLTSPRARRHLLAGVDDPVALGPFWAWFEGLSDGERQQAIAPVMNKLRPFLLRPRVRGVLGQLSPRLELERVFTHRKVLLVSLAKGLLGPEASALLGSLVVAELWHAALGRVAVPPEMRGPVSVFIDEFQDYLHLPTDLADALAQARGLGVGLTLAHQHLAQLTPQMRSAVLANARSQVCFQLASEDAIAFARTTRDLEAEDFQRLSRFEVYLRLVAGGEVTGFASGKTLPPSTVISDPEQVRATSRERYGRPVAEIEAEIRRLIEGDRDDSESLGRRPRKKQ